MNSMLYDGVPSYSHTSLIMMDMELSSKSMHGNVLAAVFICEWCLSLNTVCHLMCKPGIPASLAIITVKTTSELCSFTIWLLKGIPGTHLIFMQICHACKIARVAPHRPKSNLIHYESYEIMSITLSVNITPLENHCCWDLFFGL